MTEASVWRTVLRKLGMDESRCVRLEVTCAKCGGSLLFYAVDVELPLDDPGQRLFGRDADGGLDAAPIVAANGLLHMEGLGEMRRGADGEWERWQPSDAAEDEATPAGMIRSRAYLGCATCQEFGPQRRYDEHVADVVFILTSFHTRRMPMWISWHEDELSWRVAELRSRASS